MTTAHPEVTSYAALLKALNPQDRTAVEQGFTYRIDHPNDRVEYARSLQAATDVQRRKMGEAQPQLTALPWMRTPWTTPRGELPGRQGGL